MKVTGIVLAGGQSRRMGVDKALVELNGKTLMEHSISILQELTPAIIISSGNPQVHFFGFPVIEDVYPHIGPVAGLYSALNASLSEHNIVLPCDTPHVGVSLYEKLLESEGSFDAVVAGTPDGLIEPLIGYYHRSVKYILEEQIQQGDYKLQNALQRMNTKVELFADKHRFLNINTRSDLTSAGGPAYHCARIGDGLST